MLQSHLETIVTFKELNKDADEVDLIMLEQDKADAMELIPQKSQQLNSYIKAFVEISAADEAVKPETKLEIKNLVQKIGIQLEGLDKNLADVERIISNSPKL